MHAHDLSAWTHEHHFDAGNSAAERGTRAVTWITLVMMVVEIATGMWFNSMALLADGWHMSSHALAIGLSAFAYSAARRYARDPRFAFGTWKFEVLGGFASAIFLLGVAGLMVFGSIERLISPQAVHYPEAMAVAAVGLVVNLVCALILGGAHDHSHGHGHSHGHDHDEDHDHGHEHGSAREPSPSENSTLARTANVQAAQGHATHGPVSHDHSAHEHTDHAMHGHTDHDHDHSAHGHSEHGHEAHDHSTHDHTDHVSGLHSATPASGAHAVPVEDGPKHADLNLKSAYIHVVADAATSVLAIVALAGGWFYDWAWLDPAMGLVGAVLVAVWAKNLIRETGTVLLDREMDHPVVERVRQAITTDAAHGDTRVSDLHIWRVGRNSYAAALSLVTHDTTLTPSAVRSKLAAFPEIGHATIEIERCCTD